MQTLIESLSYACTAQQKQPITYIHNQVQQTDIQYATRANYHYNAASTNNNSRSRSTLAEFADQTQQSHNKNFRIRSAHSPQFIAVLLLSITACRAQGNNDDDFSCALLHSSIAPLLFSKVENSALLSLLSSSNNIEWLNEIQFTENMDHLLIFDIIQRLSNSRYSSRSLRKVVAYNLQSVLFLNFIQEHCLDLKELIFMNRVSVNGISIIHLLPFAHSLEKLVFQGDLDLEQALIQPFNIQEDPDFPILTIDKEADHSGYLRCIELLPLMKALVHLELTGTSMSDQQFQKFRLMTHLRHLKLTCVSDFTGSSFEEVFSGDNPKLTLFSLHLLRCPDLQEVSGIRHLVFLESLLLSDIPTRSTLPQNPNFRQQKGIGFIGASQWVSFPYLKKLNLFINYGFQEEEPLENLFSSSFPALQQLTFAFRTTDNKALTAMLRLLRASNPHQLREVHITPRGKITPEILHELSKCQRLESVIFRNVDFTSCFEEIEEVENDSDLIHNTDDHRSQKFYKVPNVPFWTKSAATLKTVKFLCSEFGTPFNVTDQHDTTHEPIPYGFLDFLTPCVNIEMLVVQRKIKMPCKVMSYSDAVKQSIIPHRIQFFSSRTPREYLSLKNEEADKNSIKVETQQEEVAISTMTPSHYEEEKLGQTFTKTTEEFNGNETSTAPSTTHFETHLPKIIPKEKAEACCFCW